MSDVLVTGNAVPEIPGTDETVDVFDQYRTAHRSLAWTPRPVGGGITFYESPGLSYRNVASVGIGGNATNTDIFTVMFVISPITITNFAFWVITAPASDSTIQIGVYSADDAFQPDVLQIATSKVVPAAATGLFTVSGANTVLTRGVYLVGTNRNVTCTTRGCLGVALRPPHGVSEGTGDVALPAAIAHFTKSRTSATFPASASWDGTRTASGWVSIVLLECAAYETP